MRLLITTILSSFGGTEISIAPYGANGSGLCNEHKTVKVIIRAIIV